MIRAAKWLGEPHAERLYTDYPDWLVEYAFAAEQAEIKAHNEQIEEATKRANA